ncbi:MAG: DUF1329 domain-containing protein [Myxococcota bacterium]|nr:DUF1329 domain-containing protein [Myxococcota bacterium]
MRLSSLACLVLFVLVPAPLLADGEPSPWELPEPGSCATQGGLVSAGSGPADDAVSVPFQTGDVFSLDTLEVLKNFVPESIWEHREKFFFEGMRLEIGPCFFDYSAPAFYQEATTANAGSASLDADGGLVGYAAGQPFPMGGVALDDPTAGIKILWNAEMRYQGAGFRGKFRNTDLVGRVGRAEPFEGEMFKMLMAGRADLPDEKYIMKGARGKQFVAGGLFYKPFDAREYAWRQFRDIEHYTSVKRSDDLHAYVPNMRRVRRLSANQVEGLYMPSFSVGVVPTQQIAGASGSGASFGGGASMGSVGVPGGSVQNKRSGYEGLVIRPLLYEAKILGLHDVLTPINSASAAYPENPDRDFGPWGLSFANDRWDLRRALVIEMRTTHELGNESLQAARQILYLDLQTLHPIYVATFDKNEEMTNVGMYASRWSEDREDYPKWPDDEDRPIRILDSIGASMANLSQAGSWRRESWDNVGTPPNDRELRGLVSVNQLTKRR